MSDQQALYIAINKKGMFMITGAFTTNNKRTQFENGKLDDQSTTRLSSSTLKTSLSCEKKLLLNNEKFLLDAATLSVEICKATNREQDAQNLEFLVSEVTKSSEEEVEVEVEVELKCNALTELVKKCDVVLTKSDLFRASTQERWEHNLNSTNKKILASLNLEPFDVVNEHNLEITPTSDVVILGGGACRMHERIKFFCRAI